MINNFGLMLAQIPKTAVALAVFREAIRTEDNNLIHKLLHSLGQDLGSDHVSSWVVQEVLPTMSPEEVNYLEQKVLAFQSIGNTDNCDF